MQYTVCNRGRPIGVTDLGFARYDSFARAGWFHPNADGEKVMPIVTSVHVALHAWSRHRRAAERAPRHPPHERRSTEDADVAEALQHTGSLELTLHREDGSLVPTELIGLQDTEQLLARAREDDGPLGDALETGSWLDELENDADADHDLQRLLENDEFGDGETWSPDDSSEPCSPDDSSEPWAPDDSSEPWAPDEDRAEWPRYQIIVRLAEADVIP